MWSRQAYFSMTVWKVQETWLCSEVCVCQPGVCVRIGWCDALYPNCPCSRRPKVGSFALEIFSTKSFVRTDRGGPFQFCNSAYTFSPSACRWLACSLFTKRKQQRCCNTLQLSCSCSTSRRVQLLSSVVTPYCTNPHDANISTTKGSQHTLMLNCWGLVLLSEETNAHC